MRLRVKHNAREIFPTATLTFHSNLMQLVLRACIPRSCPLRAARILWGQRQEREPGPSETDVGRWHLSASCGTMYISAVPHPSLQAKAR